MEAGRILFCVLVGAAILAVSCASPPPPAPATQTPAGQPPQNPPPAQPATGGTPPAQRPAGTFVASEELYRATFSEVQEVIAAITHTISVGDYEGWTGYLTADYIASRSSAEFLADASSAPILKKNGIVLRSLKDYFQNVVVKSRLQATLDDIQFLDEMHVKAIALVQGTPVILYFLVKENARWKVGLKSSGEG